MFVSEAQRRRAQRMVERGEVSKEKFKEWEKDTADDLPERVAKKKRRKKIVFRRSKKYPVF